MTTTLDIETGPEIEEIIRKFTKPFPPFSEEECKAEFATARDATKGPAFIAKKREEHKLDEAKYWKKAFDNAALDPLTGRILSIGLKGANGVELMLTAEDGDNEQEKAMLIHFFAIVGRHLARSHKFTGFNLFGFDLDFIVKRALKYGLSASIMRAGRYWAPCFHDLMEDWRGNNKTDFISLDTLLLYLGLPPKSGCGADFAKKFKEDRKSAMSYLHDDLDREERVAKVFGVFNENFAGTEGIFDAPGFDEKKVVNF